MKHVENMVRYWRHSLADADLGKGCFAGEDIQRIGYLEFPFEDYCNGRLSGHRVLFPKPDVAGSTASDVIKVTIRPFVYLRRANHSHGVAIGTGRPAIIAPIAHTAWLHRSGRLYTNARPVIARDLMDPLVQENGYVVTGVEDFDSFIDQNAFRGREGEPIIGKTSGEDVFTWGETVAYVEEMAGILKIEEAEYSVANYCLICAAESSDGVGRKIIDLYDQTLADKPEVPLLEKIVHRNLTPAAPRTLSITAESAVGLRLGHSDPKYPLAQAQRDVITHFLALPDEEALAVNGPPGTGKTTLLQSLLACLMVSRALERKDPPVVFACSTNNQAVTNIIDAFGKVPDKEGDPFFGRWVPGITTLGVYYPAGTQKSRAIENGYFMNDTLDNLEKDGEYLEDARTHYLGRAAAAFGKPFREVTDVVETLHKRLHRLSEQMVTVLKLFTEIAELENACARFFGTTNSCGNLQEIAERNAMEAVRVETTWKNAMHSWEQYLLAEPWWAKIFRFIPGVKQKSQIRQRIALTDYEQAIGDAWKIVTANTEEDIEALIREGLGRAKRDVLQFHSVAEKGRTLLAKIETARKTIGNAIDRCVPNTGIVSLDEFDVMMDTTLRHQMFKLAIHYYEGLWLSECATLAGDPDRKSPKKQARRARRQAKVTPCCVATFHMAPGLFQAYDVPNKRNLPAYSFADVLIVDEVGQVSPEVAGATFALARKALVVGDIWQIEPVWSADTSADGGNLVQCGIVRPGLDADEWEAIHARGYTASAGSVMKIAQNASAFHYAPKLERGMYLFEHRRCADSIIQYCNDLCYHGALVPRTGEPKDPLYPTLGYMDIPGRCSNERGSRVNLIEAEAIAAWIANEAERMRQTYGKAIEEIIAVVTPFKAQANAIKRAMTKRDPALGKITAGTVHSLQGAERLVIVFSPTYDAQATGRFFFDRGVNMLNVAVSRAKYSFLVFGSMAIFNASASTPSGLLARHLGKTGSHQLPFPAIDEQLAAVMRKTCTAPPTSLFTPDEHDRFLVDSLNTAAKHLSIVSPWLSEFVVNKHAHSFAKAIARGVDIRVIYDQNKIKTPGHATALQRLKDLKIATKAMKSIHSKLLNKDNRILTTGSFNWLSAQRNDGELANRQIDHTIIYDTDVVGKEEVELQVATIRRVFGKWEQQHKH